MDNAQLNLREPEQVDWDFKGSTYSAPPPAIGPDGKPIVYQGVAKDIKESDPDDGYLNFLIDPIELVRSGAFDKTQIRFTRASAKPFLRDGQPMRGNPNKLAGFVKALGGQTKPQTNSDYRAVIAAGKGKPFSFTIDWEAYNKETGERVKGFNAFPEDPERPGQKKSILRKGDMYNEVDNKGNILGQKVVESEVLFANPRLRFFVDATPKVGGR